LPSRREDLMQHPNYQDGGVWMLADIDLSRLNMRAVRKAMMSEQEA